MPENNQIFEKSSGDTSDFQNNSGKEEKKKIIVTNYVTLKLLLKFVVTCKSFNR